MYSNQIDDLRERIRLIKETVSLSSVVSQYNIKLSKDGRNLKGLCPFHNERTPSFFVYDDRTYHCYGCKEHGDVINFLMKMTNLGVKQVVEFLDGRFITPAKAYNIQLPKPKPKESKINLKDYEKIPEFNRGHIFSTKDSSFKAVSVDEIYRYTFADGQPCGYILVKRNKQTGKKIVRPVSLYECPKQGLVWAFKGMETPRPLYNLPELLANKDKPVLVVEGEKCAEIAKKHLPEFIVTTWAQGSSSVDQTDWSPLEKREVFIWPDNDPNGKEAAEKIAKGLQYAEVIQVSDSKPKGWDIADAISEGMSTEELTQLILYFRVPREVAPEAEINFDMPPGLLGELTKYILSASTIENPILATGAALAVLATLQAQKCITEDYIHPNLYIVSLATSGVGKSFPIAVSKAVLRAIGCGKLICGNPASGAAIISSLHRRMGRGYFPIDEFGDLFSQITDKNAGTYQRDIIGKLLKLFSDSQSEYIDDEYSDRDKQREIRTIRKPNAVIYGTTVPHNFYKAVHADEGANGFLARLLVLSVTQTNGYRKKADEVIRELPDNLKAVLTTWAYDPTNILGYDENNYDFAPQVIKYESSARKLLHEFGDECSQISQEAEEKGDTFRSSLYRRCFEKASKLALLARSTNEYIDLKATEWAINITRSATEKFYQEAKNYIHENDFDKHAKSVERYLNKKEKWVTKSEISNRFRMPLKKMKEILDYLEESGIIETKSLQKKSASTPTQMFRFKYKTP